MGVRKVRPERPCSMLARDSCCRRCLAQLRGPAPRLHELSTLRNDKKVIVVATAIISEQSDHNNNSSGESTAKELHRQRHDDLNAEFWLGRR